ncbi:MAG: PorP/SprF family type IX secretion system membrane protein [Cytophagales bacterium]|nr:PorP/SprF family type IX secretion system membrane protein [Cytophagales bacterium]
MNKKLCILWVLLGVLVSGQVVSQDFYFSQYFNSPIATNPALTGKIKQDFRVALIHRSQWRSVSTPYGTTSGSFDMNFRKVSPFFNLMGAGLYFTNDDLGDGVFRNQYVMGSIAGHKTLDNQKRHTLSFGIQAGMVFKSVNSNGFVFRNQYDNNLQLTQASGENLARLNYNYFNLNAGLNWDFIISPVTKLSTGISMFNLTGPKDSPLNTSNRLSFRYTAHTALEYEIGYNFSIQPNIYYIYQAGAQNFYPGLIASYTVDKSGLFENRTFYLGGWYRLKDSGVALAGVKEGKYQIWFSYDFTASDLNNIQRAPDLANARSVMGAWEISLIYTGFLKRYIPNSRTIPCRFF